MSARLAWLAAAALALGASAWLASTAFDPAHRVRPSEPGWISSGALTFSLLRECAGPERWSRAHAEADLGSFGTLNPPLGKLLFGAAVATVRDPADPVRYLWDFRESRRVNLRRGNVPPRPLVDAARSATLLCTAGTLLLVYAALRRASGAPWLSLAAPALLLAVPIFRSMSTLAFTDVPQLFFLSASLAAAVHWAASGGRAWLGAAAAAAGAACAVKYSAASFVLALGIFALARPGPVWRRGGECVLAGSVAVAVFVLVNPHFWVSPWLRLSGLLAGWSWVLEQQRGTPALAGLATASAWQGLLFTLREAWWGAGFAPGFVALLGLAGALRLARGPGAAESRAAYGLLAVVAATALLVTGLWLPFEWPRYTLPAILAAVPVQALGLLWLADALRARGPRAVR